MNRNFEFVLFFIETIYEIRKKLVTFAIVPMDICGIEMKTTITNNE